jgi:hypothetical protein
LIFGDRNLDSIGFGNTNYTQITLNACKLLISNGGEGGIRTQDRLGLSVRYRFDIAKIAKFAIIAADHCTLLHATVGVNPWGETREMNTVPVR